MPQVTDQLKKRYLEFMYSEFQNYIDYYQKEDYLRKSEIDKLIEEEEAKNTYQPIKIINNMIIATGDNFRVLIPVEKFRSVYFKTTLNLPRYNYKMVTHSNTTHPVYSTKKYILNKRYDSFFSDTSRVDKYINVWDNTFIDNNGTSITNWRDRKRDAFVSIFEKQIGTNTQLLYFEIYQKYYTAKIPSVNNSSLTCTFSTEDVDKILDALINDG